jgi:SAM-dependent MidA family methyltransferase
MDLVLYHPQQGYYATGAVNIGSEGDFFTSPHLGRDFGELLAEQFAQMWHILGHPTPFTLWKWEQVKDSWQQMSCVTCTGIPDCFNALDYIIVEKAAGLIAQQKQLLQRLRLPNEG